LQPQKRDADGLSGGSRQQRNRDDDARTQQLAATVLGSVKKTSWEQKGRKHQCSGNIGRKKDAAHEKRQERQRRDVKKNRRQRKVI
jgi:hypothetical protein